MHLVFGPGTIAIFANVQYLSEDRNSLLYMDTMLCEDFSYHYMCTMKYSCLPDEPLRINTGNNMNSDLDVLKQTHFLEAVQLAS